jgi:hypothetical protein
MSETTKLILLDSLLQKVVATLPHFLMQKEKKARTLARTMGKALLRRRSAQRVSS